PNLLVNGAPGHFAPHHPAEVAAALRALRAGDAAAATRLRVDLPVGGEASTEDAARLAATGLGALRVRVPSELGPQPAKLLFDGRALGPDGPRVVAPGELLARAAAALGEGAAGERRLTALEAADPLPRRTRLVE
ncbi:MAG: hypothetical protein IT385_05140, partial [Deltaproteobacteria bacterium]|nr:hypothetical protein [Deltaproteobacteria bacterium]